jgi:RNA polymerase sigma-70 factor (ECF subfamily)
MNSETSFAFEDFSKYEGYLKGFAYKLTQDWHHAEDLFQETAFLAFKNQNKFRSGSNLRAWLTTIMRNTFINQHRKRQRSVFTDKENWMDYLDDRTVENDAEEDIAANEIISLIDELGNIYKEPFVMYVTGYKYREIAKKMDLPVGTIKSRIFVARKELKTALVNRQMFLELAS